MHRWTNPTPYYITNMRVITDDMTFIDEYVYKDRDIDPDDEVFAPRGYGIIVVDMKNKVIVDAQDYMSVGKISTLDAFPSTEPDPNAIMSFSHINDGWAEDYERMEAFVKAGRVTRFNPYKELNRVDFSALTSPASIMKSIKDRKLAGAFIVDMSPYRIEKYDHRDFSKILARLKELGFSFNDVDVAAWNEAIEQDG